MAAGKDIKAIVDIHCHALWGVDDGPASIDETLRMLGRDILPLMRTVTSTVRPS